MNSVLKVTGDLIYRFGLGPQPSDVPDHRLVELVEGPDKLAPGRALDLGSATGRNSIYLARHGWETIGVEFVGYAVELAKRKAAAEAVPARFVKGDVTRLADLDIGAGFSLFMDGGCYHGIPPNRRNAYAESVTAVAAPGGRLIMVGFGRVLGWGMDRDELLPRLPGWQLLNVRRVPGEQMYQYISGPAPMRAALKRGAFHPMRYELERVLS